MPKSNVEVFGCGKPEFKLGSIVPADHWFNEYVEIWVPTKWGKKQLFFPSNPGNVAELNEAFYENVDDVCAQVGGGATPDVLEDIKERVEVRDEGGLAGAIYRYSTELADGNWFVYAITRGYA